MPTFDMVVGSYRAALEGIPESELVIAHQPGLLKVGYELLHPGK